MRGLKQGYQAHTERLAQSHPSWVRGLKLTTENNLRNLLVSHPSWVRGLKHVKRKVRVYNLRSHPSWVRGLKQKAGQRQKKLKNVAPFVGAWIETALPLSL